ncbi:MAG: M23 family metallopeptidase [Myxococcales bacterium]|nr:M23 family metallopeptidase [Myxococcales bacterium]
MRLDPFTGAHRHHDGVDIAAPEGTAVHATRDGIVRSVKEDPGYGHVVILDHGGGRETRYAHCATILVTAGERVSRGDKIATVGQSGRATGPHLHFEVRENGQPIDPEGPRSDD